MGVLNFFKSADPFKVKTGERTLAKDERARTEDVAAFDARPATAGKSPTALRRLIKQGANDVTGFGSTAISTEDFASSFITLILEHE
uniref:Uncharacterized protein n=1 Tax=Tanacetum cinerariifolium TaxID=118510 RepID=A0A6L2MWD0_TANCI|nr:hypothetical protein [Tanacetum cinerariifolium]